MARLEIKGKETIVPEKVITFSLERGIGGVIKLIANDYNVLHLNPDGTFRRIGCIGCNSGLKLDGWNRIVEEK